MIQKVGLVIPDSAQALIDSGKLVRTDGVLRNAETMEIFKHLDIIDLEDTSALEEFGVAVKRLVDEHPIGVAIGATVAVVISVVAGIKTHHKKKNQKALEETCNAYINRAIKNYTDAAQMGKLDIETIKQCEDALISLPQITEKVFVSMAKEQIVEFTRCMRSYTLQLAEENDYEIENMDSLEYTDNVVSFMVYNLRAQKEILQNCA